MEMSVAGAGSATAGTNRGAESLAGQDEFLFPCVRPTYARPLVLTEGDGVWVRDPDGRAYLDLFAGILTTSVGHCHPEVVERTAEQMRRLGHTSTLYVTDNQVRVAKRIAGLAPGRLSRSFFTNSGTEAIETAVMVASIFTGRSEIVALKLAYHGRSYLATSLTAQAAWRPLPSSVPGISHAASPYPYRCPFKSPCDASCTEAFARDLEEVILTTTSGRPAALIAETIQGVGGYVVPPAGYFGRVAEIIRSYGGLLIIDEVQTGWGRTGQHWFGIEHWGVEPDIMVMAKGVANGFPVGVTITRDEIAAAWSAKTISTFGGNPVAMAAAEATLDVMEREDTPERSQVRGNQLGAGLRLLETQHEWIGEVRGMGLMWAMEMVRGPEAKEPDPGRATRLVEAARDEGLLVGIGGVHGHVVRIGPSMLISEAELGEGLARLERACTMAGGGRS